MQHNAEENQRSNATYRRAPLANPVHCVLCSGTILCLPDPGNKTTELWYLLNKVHTLLTTSSPST